MRKEFRWLYSDIWQPLTSNLSRSIELTRGHGEAYRNVLASDEVVSSILPVLPLDLIVLAPIFVLYSHSGQYFTSEEDELSLSHHTFGN